MKLVKRIEKILDVVRPRGRCKPVRRFRRGVARVYVGGREVPEIVSIEGKDLHVVQDWSLEEVLKQRDLEAE